MHSVAHPGHMCGADGVPVGSAVRVLSPSTEPWVRRSEGPVHIRHTMGCCQSNRLWGAPLRPFRGRTFAWTSVPVEDVSCRTDWSGFGRSSQLRHGFRGRHYRSFVCRKRRFFWQSHRDAGVVPVGAIRNWIHAFGCPGNDPAAHFARHVLVEVHQCRLTRGSNCGRHDGGTGRKW